MAPVPPRRSSAQKPRTKLPRSARPASQSIFTRDASTKDTATSSETAFEALNSHPLSSHSALPSNKRDKRQISHSLLLSRLKGNKPGSSANKIQKKRARERENKRSKTQLSSRLKDLADVLPEEESKGNATVRQARSSTSTAASRSDAAGLKTKKGHTRRLQKLKELERERFKRNLDVMGKGAAGGGGAGPQGEKEVLSQVAQAFDESTGITEQSPNPQRNRWAALRAHISRQQANP